MSLAAHVVASLPRMLAAGWMSALLTAGCGGGTAGEGPRPDPAEPALTIAVASNFAVPAAVLAERFTGQTGTPVALSAGATGALYAQIVHGAPFDAFFAADVERPLRLEQEGRAVSGSRFTYAVGRLVLWSPDPGLVDPAGAVLAAGDFRHLAIADPDTAPYGRAARAVLSAQGVWPAVQPKLVVGQNVAQAYQFVVSGNAELGFVARSLLRADARSPAGSAWEPPAAWHAPIEQQAVILRDGGDIRAFMAFVGSRESRALLQSAGYEVP